MEKYIIRGGRKLNGSVKVHASKNAVLPILAASILTEEKVRIRNCPGISDVVNMLEILRILGCRIDWEGSDVVIDSSQADKHKIPVSLAKKLRSSIFMLGSIIGRFGSARISYPGGCDIGLRPIDLHIKGLKSLNVDIVEHFGMIDCNGKGLCGGVINLDFPSVGATENIMMAATLAKGKTVILNAAKEPEIEDLQNFINAMGGKVSGAGSSTVEIEGVSELHGAEYSPMPDRIVAGTYLIAGAMCGGEIEVQNVNAEHIQSVLFKLRESACKIECNRDKIVLTAPERLQACHLIETNPYPGFATDLQAQMLAALSIAEGTSVIVENIFETRFKHAGELVKMGANITIRDRMAVVRGVPQLSGAEVFAFDLRGGAALVLAGLAAAETTIVNDIYHIERGYFEFEKNLSALGADICKAD